MKLNRIRTTAWIIVTVGTLPAHDFWLLPDFSARAGRAFKIVAHTGDGFPIGDIDHLHDDAWVMSRRFGGSLGWMPGNESLYILARKKCGSRAKKPDLFCAVCRFRQHGLVRSSVSSVSPRTCLMEIKVGSDSRQSNKVSEPGKSLRDRRESPRLTPSDLPVVKATTIVAGPEVQVVNVSRRGILFASEMPVSPGIRVHLRLIAAGMEPVILTGTILRSRLETLQEGQPIYHSAVAIDQDFPLLARAGDTPFDSLAEDVPPAPEAPETGEEEILTLTALMPETGPDINQIIAEIT